MIKDSQMDNDEVNLIELMHTIWKGKWKIAAAVVISFLAMISYQSTQTNNFTAITEIKPVSSLTINKYSILNNINNLNATEGKRKGTFVFSRIKIQTLLNLYIDILNDKSIFEDAIRKFNLLDASKYSDEQKYNEAIGKLASSIIILTPLIDTKEQGNLQISYHTVNFIHDDIEKWKNVLIYVDELANQLVKKKILNDYNNALSSLELYLKYQLENIETLMKNTQIDFDREVKKFEMNRKFQLEDAQTKIDNSLLDYNRMMTNRILFLREQATIARELKVAKNTIEIETFDTKSRLVSNVKTDSPFYMRGYVAIEKEIELIQLRDNNEAFVVGLLKLQQEKRILNQDRTFQRLEKNKIFLDSITELEKKRRAIEQDKTIERVELAFKSTPIANKNEFSAASIKVYATKIQYKRNNLIILAIAIGLIVGVFYVIISNAFQSQRVSKKS